MGKILFLISFLFLIFLIYFLTSAIFFNSGCGSAVNFSNSKNSFQLKILYFAISFQLFSLFGKEKIILLDCFRKLTTAIFE